MRDIQMPLVSVQTFGFNQFFDVGPDCLLVFQLINDIPVGKAQPACQLLAFNRWQPSKSSKRISTETLPTHLLLCCPRLPKNLWKDFEHQWMHLPSLSGPIHEAMRHQDSKSRLSHAQVGQVAVMILMNLNVLLPMFFCANRVCIIVSEIYGDQW